MKNELKIPAGHVRAESLLLDAAGDYACRATLGEGAELHLTAFVLAKGEEINFRLDVDLESPNARFHLHGLYIVTGKGHADINVRINHLAPNCTSRQLVKGIAGGHSEIFPSSPQKAESPTGSFTGMIHVARDAQHTDAALHNRNLQLTDTAQIFTRPQLEIYADDVKCGHGASIGRLDEETVYYMRQRGIGEKEARRIQVQGFAGEIINRCPSEALREVIAARANEMIEQF